MCPQAVVAAVDRERGHVQLATAPLEPFPGAMLRNPQRVFRLAEEMLAQRRRREEAAAREARLQVRGRLLLSSP